MLQPVSEPLIPAQPSEDRYPIYALGLFREFTRETYRATFGVEAPAYDASRPVKSWFDLTADTSSKGHVAVYRVLAPDGSGLTQMVIPAIEAATVNLPVAGGASGVARGLPLRALLSNERLAAGPNGVVVIRTDLVSAVEGFIEEDRRTLLAIHDFLMKPGPAYAGGLFGTSYVEVAAPPPAAPRMPHANSADAYWAAQPVEVQALRSMPENAAREARAYELAAKGFKIDRRIMVQGWDPLSSMSVLKSAGYTWIPALGQPDIEVSPGLTFAGRKTYDPAAPPPGSIVVSTAFADGYER